jgi:hypothetical protein
MVVVFIPSVIEAVPSKSTGVLLKMPSMTGDSVIFGIWLVNE